MPEGNIKRISDGIDPEHDLKDARPVPNRAFCDKLGLSGSDPENTCAPLRACTDTDILCRVVVFYINPKRILLPVDAGCTVVCNVIRYTADVEHVV